MIKKIDHVVITTRNMVPIVEFYQKLGFKVKDKGNRMELYAGDFKINVHMKDNELFPHAKHVQSGSGDFCFEIQGSIELFRKKLMDDGIEMEVDLVERHGFYGIMKSIYLRDPDGNLVELSSYE